MEPFSQCDFFLSDVSCLCQVDIKPLRTGCVSCHSFHTHAEKSTFLPLNLTGYETSFSCVFISLFPKPDCCSQIFFFANKIHVLQHLFQPYQTNTTTSVTCQILSFSTMASASSLYMPQSSLLVAFSMWVTFSCCRAEISSPFFFPNGKN